MTDFPADFLACVDRVVGEEGGYVNDPRDPGGETKFGISKRSFPHIDIANLTRDAAIQIYFDSYWTPASRHFPPNASLQFKRCIFESCINQGEPRTVVLLGLAKGQLSWFQASRAIAYMHDKGFEAYGLGWLRRLFAEMEV